ncbi:MAG: hypothetical protein AAB307_04090, partial [Deltaproteobacteria bacterium]
MEDLEATVLTVLNDLLALPEEGMRLNLLCRRLFSLTDDDAAGFIDILCKMGTDNKAGPKARALLVDQQGLKSVLGDKYRQIYLASVRLGLHRVSRLFSELRPYKKGLSGYEQEEEALMEFITLGQRRSMSKGAVKDALDRLLSDPDPMVVANLLDNQRITEKEVLKIASKRPNSHEILRIISVHRKWSRRYEVKRAIASNPYALPNTSIAILGTLMTHDLKQIAGDKTLHPAV